MRELKSESYKDYRIEILLIDPRTMHCIVRGLGKSETIIEDISNFDDDINKTVEEVLKQAKEMINSWGDVQP